MEEGRTDLEAVVDKVLECFVGVAEGAGENGVLGSRLPDGRIDHSINHNATDPIGEDARPARCANRSEAEVSDWTRSQHRLTPCLQVSADDS